MKKWMVFSILTLAAVFLANCTLNSGNSPVMDEKQVTIDSGGHHLEGLLGETVAYQFLLKDEGVSLGTFAGDAFVTMLPLSVADELRAKYGDFFRCADPGAQQAIRNLQSAILIAGDDQTKQAITGALSLLRQSRIPAVEFIGAVLRIQKHTYLGLEVRDQSGIPMYYLMDFSILKSDYLE